jgi:hypothetical protein
VGRSRMLVAAIVVIAFGAGPAGALGAKAFRPRIGPAMGIVPPLARQKQLGAGDVASGQQTPVLYHGGPVMAGGVTIHTIFWAAPGYAFLGSPGAGIPTYEGMIEQFFTDVAADTSAPGTCTTSDCNAFTAERQYGSGTSVGALTPGSYEISYSAASDSIDDSDPYPSKADQCASPAGTAVCLTDDEVSSEIDHVVQSTGGSRGLHDLWFMFLPPGVDECIGAGDCGTNTFAGYHSVANVSGHGALIYAVAIDPITEGPIPAGADPQGFPDAEATLITAGHEVNEAITDPEGDGWMDPNGNEVSDKCETGPQLGVPLGFAPDGSPYNQVINGDEYLLQEEWANSDAGGNDDCVQASNTTASTLPLPQVNLRQFDPLVTGNVNRASGGGIHVRVSIIRANGLGFPVSAARATTTTKADGSWSVWLWPHAPGDDRDEIDVDYWGPGAPQPGHQVILTGNGGNPFTEAGWMGWTAMDAGSDLTRSSLALAPCFQAGALSFSFDGAAQPQSPGDYCNTETDVATVSTAPVDRADAVSWTSVDNRAFDGPGSDTPNLFGGLVSLTVPVGEPGSVSLASTPLAGFTPGGFPSCEADLALQSVACTGLVPGAKYTITDRRQRRTGKADLIGGLFVTLRLRRRDDIRLSNGTRRLTTLHVANLRVKIVGGNPVLAGGSCQPGEYYGAPLSAVPTSAAAGLPTPLSAGGVALTGEICPNSGRAAGLPSNDIMQTDELSGGLTETEVPNIHVSTPLNDETLYGGFTALARTGVALPGRARLQLSLRVVSSRGRAVVKVRNVNTRRGVHVGALSPGRYGAIWTLTDFNGDTRTVETAFVEA